MAADGPVVPNTVETGKAGIGHLSKGSKGGVGALALTAVLGLGGTGYQAFGTAADSKNVTEIQRGLTIVIESMDRRHVTAITHCMYLLAGEVLPVHEQPVIIPRAAEILDGEIEPE